jgi:hypothetical protein
MSVNSSIAGRVGEGSGVEDKVGMAVSVTVGGTSVAVGGTGVAVGGTGVSVGMTAAVVGEGGSGIWVGGLIAQPASRNSVTVAAKLNRWRDCILSPSIGKGCGEEIESMVKSS